MTIRGPYKVLASRNVYRNPWINVREDKIIRPDGAKGLFGVVEMKSGSSVLAINDKNEAYLVKEYKYGIDKESIELISGALEKKESPLRAAKRELKEELGLEADKWVNLGVVNPFTTVVNSPNYMFLAIGIKKNKSRPDSEEILKIIKVPFKRTVDMVMKGEITHSASCVLILKAEKYLRQHK